MLLTDPGKLIYFFYIETYINKYFDMFISCYCYFFKKHFVYFFYFQKLKTKIRIKRNWFFHNF